MTAPNHTPRPPALNDLMARFLAQRAAAGDQPTAGSEVEPHEVVGGFRTPTQTTWTEAVAALRFAGVKPEVLAAPPEWAAFAEAELHPAVVPLGAGFFPQAVRDMTRVRFGATTRTTKAVVPGFSVLRAWVQKALRSGSPTQLLVASGIAASLGDVADADAALAAAEPLAIGAWRAAWENQRIAVALVLGRGCEPVTETVPAFAFNRGLAAILAGQRADGSRLLADSSVALPDNSGWKHLAGLYAVVAKA